MTEKFDELELGFIAAGLVAVTKSVLKNGKKENQMMTIGLALRTSKKVLNEAARLEHLELIEAATTAHNKIKEIVMPYVMANSASLN